MLRQYKIPQRVFDRVRFDPAVRLCLQRQRQAVTVNGHRRRAEVLNGGSLYWVIAGSMLARQRILDIIDDHYEDKSTCTGLVLDPNLVPLVGRPTRPFQGWRYLEPGAAPPDLPETGAVRGLDGLPAALRLELRALCLL